MDQSTLIQIAFSLYNNKGAYALLLGSGVSKAAGVPTGWEISIELIRQIASLHGEDCSPDPEKWYLGKFGKQPGYSDLLDHLGKTPTERNAFIKTFIEPAEDERAEGKKQPTAAHRAIARLVSSGVVKVIITTNFDRLIERAIEDEGIVPTVIASEDAAVGATPMIHSSCTIIKLNGDYLDTRSKNTAVELLSYDAEINRLLERVFDEFGLLICGWSADWDIGLCSTLERTKGRRYSCYWTTKSALSDKATTLSNLRSAIQVQILDANSFFSALEEKISAISDMRRPHPLSPELAVVSLKKYVAEEKYRIKMHGLVMDEAKRVCNVLAGERFPMTGAPAPTRELQEQRIHQYADELHTLIPLLINGCWWGKADCDDLWIRVVEMLANCVENRGGYDRWIELRMFPAAYALHAAGVAAVSSKRYDLLAKLLHEPKIALPNGHGSPIDHLYLQSVANAESFPDSPEGRRRRTPLNDIVFERLKKEFSDLLPDPKEFESMFERFEYYFALSYAQVHSEPSTQNGVEFLWVPPCRFVYRSRSSDTIGRRIKAEIEKSKGEWPPIKQGLFHGTHESLLVTQKLIDSFSSMASLRW